MNKTIKTIYFLIIMTQANLTQADVEISKYVTKNGVEILYTKSENIPMIDIKITFDAGSNKDGELKGLSMLTHSLLDEGTSKMNSEAIASAFESTGAIFSTSVNKDKSSVSLRSLADKKYLEPSVKMLLKILSDSVFPKSEVILQKERTLSSISEDKSDPSEVSSNLFFKEIYGNYAYGFPSIGSEESIEKVVGNSDSIINKVNKEIKVYKEEDHTSKIGTELLEKWEEYKDLLNELGGVEVVPKGPYMSVMYGSKTLCYCIFKSSQILVEMVRGNIKTDGTKSKNFFSIDDPKNISKPYSWTWKNGTKGNVYKIRFDNKLDINYLMFLVKQKYDSLNS